MEQPTMETKAENPFELVPYEGLFVPKVLLNSEREKDLADYMTGWNAQKKNRIDQVVPRKAEEGHRTEIRSAVTWYEAGAAKCWSLMQDPNEEGRAGEPNDLVQTLEHMRANPGFIPDDAWPRDGDKIDQPLDQS